MSRVSPPSSEHDADHLPASGTPYLPPLSRHNVSMPTSQMPLQVLLAAFFCFLCNVLIITWLKQSYFLFKICFYI